MAQEGADGKFFAGADVLDGGPSDDISFAEFGDNVDGGAGNGALDLRSNSIFSAAYGGSGRDTGKAKRNSGHHKV